MRPANDIAGRIEYERCKLIEVMRQRQEAIMMLDWAEVSRLTELEMCHRGKLDALCWVLQQIVTVPATGPRVVQISNANH